MNCATNLDMDYRITDGQKALFTEAYLLNKTVTESGKLIGLSPYQSFNYSHQISLPIRPKSVTGRKYYANSRYFEKIDTEEKAYWLGFIAADGCVDHGRNKRLRLILSTKDKGHLVKYKRSLLYTGPISESNKYYRNAVEINDEQLVEDLVQYYIVPRKTWTVAPPVLDKSLMHHYWRGCFDGDGSIGSYASTKNARVYSLQFCGNEKMVFGFAKFIEGKISHWCNPFNKKNNFYQLSYKGCELPKRVADIIYKNATIYLDRKKKIIDELLATKTLANHFRTKEDFEELIKTCKTNIEIGAHLGIDARTVGHWRKKFGI